MHTTKKEKQFVIFIFLSYQIIYNLKVSFTLHYTRANNDIEQNFNNTAENSTTLI